MAAEPYSANALEDRLDEILDPVLSSRRTATRLAETIAPLARDLQDFTLHWTAVIARTNPEMAYQFAAAAPQGLARLDLACRRRLDHRGDGHLRPRRSLSRQRRFQEYR